MSVNLVRTRFSAYAVKIETTAGTDVIAGSPVLADYVLGRGSFRFNAGTVQDPSQTGSLDDAAGIVTALQPTIEMTVPLRGSGTAGTATSWGRLMRACTFEEVVDGTGVAGAVATAGTTTTATLGTGYGTTAQAYRGLPAVLSGNPAVSTISPITNYTTGKVATFGETFGTALNTSTNVAIPANVLYRPTSDESTYKTVTIYCYGDGLLWVFVGCVGSVKLDLTSGGMGMLTFSMKGTFSAVSAASVPTALTAGNAQVPPIWVAGRSRLLGEVARCRTLSIDAGVGTVLPDNPEATSGYDPAVPISRAVRTTLDPLMDTTKQVALFGNFTNGTGGSLFAVVGSTAGNRFAVTQPAIRILNADPGDNGGLMSNQIAAQGNSTDANFFLCAF